MINVYIPSDLYRILSICTTFNRDKDGRGFSIVLPEGTIFIQQKPFSFFEELNKSQPLMDALIQDHKEKEKQELKEQIERAERRHKDLLKKLKEL